MKYERFARRERRRLSAELLYIFLERERREVSNFIERGGSYIELYVKDKINPGTLNIPAHGDGSSRSAMDVLFVTNTGALCACACMRVCGLSVLRSNDTVGYATAMKGSERCACSQR